MHDQNRRVYEGRCDGGPLDGQTGQSRFPDGFLLVDKPAGQCWVYDWTGTGFRVRDPQPQPVDRTHRLRTADEPRFDVVAAPWIGGA